MLYLKKPLHSMIALILMALTSFSSATSLDSTKHSSGIIHFFNDKGEEKCALSVPELNQYFNFSDSNEYCENNMVSTFWLENVPSATLIHFYANDRCTDSQLKSDFYIKLKTVKYSTDWGNQTNASSIDSLRNFRDGWLLPKKNVRIEASFLGSDFNTKSLNEHISCVYIERSQPVN